MRTVIDWIEGVPTKPKVGTMWWAIVESSDGSPDFETQLIFKGDGRWEFADDEYLSCYRSRIKYHAPYSPPTE